MAKSKTFGRIYFPGNPWPAGHAVTAFEWTGRVERGTGIWFDLHLETEYYYAADGRPVMDHDDDDDDGGGGGGRKPLSDWKSRTVWSNYHACKMSSTAWLGQGYGFLVATKRDPLDLRALSGRTFRFDRPPIDLTPPRPFNVYLTGHDSVADHRVTFTRQRGKRTYNLDWQGRIAITYAGSEEFKYKFRAELGGVAFGGITFPRGTKVDDAICLIDPFVTDLQLFRPRAARGALRLVPP